VADTLVQMLMIAGSVMVLDGMGVFQSLLSLDAMKKSGDQTCKKTLVRP